MISNFNNPGIKRNFLNSIKKIHKQPILTLLNGEKVDAVLPISGTKRAPFAFNVIPKVPNECDKTRKGNKRYPDWEGRNKTVFVHK